MHTEKMLFFRNDTKVCASDSLLVQCVNQLFILHSQTQFLCSRTTIKITDIYTYNLTLNTQFFKQIIIEDNSEREKHMRKAYEKYAFCKNSNETHIKIREKISTHFSRNKKLIYFTSKSVHENDIKLLIFFLFYSLNSCFCSFYMLCSSYRFYCVAVLRIKCKT